MRLPLLRMRLPLLRMRSMALLRMTRVLGRTSSSPLVVLTHPRIIDLDEPSDNRQSSNSS